jgi:hypothetical protein
MPDSSSSLGELKAEAARITSRAARNLHPAEPAVLDAHRALAFEHHAPDHRTGFQGDVAALEAGRR